jgi:hypothetical protein
LDKAFNPKATHETNQFNKMEPIEQEYCVSRMKTCPPTPLVRRELLCLVAKRLSFLRPVYPMQADFDGSTRAHDPDGVVIAPSDYFASESAVG